MFDVCQCGSLDRTAARLQVVPNGLTIKEVTLEDRGLYVCRAMQSNPMISDFKEMNITLKIQRELLVHFLLITHAPTFFWWCESSERLSWLIIFRSVRSDKPRWDEEHTEAAYGFIGGTVNMTCSASAEPGAEFTWIKDNKTIHPSDDVQIFNSEHHSALQVREYIHHLPTTSAKRCSPLSVGSLHINAMH